jgi:predicted esterase
MLRRLFLVTVGAAFLFALGIVVAPVLPSLQEAAGSVRPAAAARAAGVTVPPVAVTEPGHFEVIERRDLRPLLPRSFEYEPPLLGGVTTQSTPDGVFPRRWQHYVPPSAGDGPSPVIVLFHGANRDGRSMIHMWKSVADAEGLVLIGLNQPAGGWRGDDPDGTYIHAVLDHADALHPIDRDRMFLSGHSAGAIMAQVVANRVHGPWRAVAVHAGTVNPGWLSRIADAPPVRHYLGAEDHIFGTEDAIAAGRLAAQAGHDHELVLIPGHTHWFYVGGPLFAADAWTWFESL